MNIEPLNMSHQSLLEANFRKLELCLSEYSFANLYLFRNLHQFKVLTCEGETFIKGLSRDGMSYIMPTKHPSKIPLKIIRDVLSHDAKILFPIPEEWLPFFDKEIFEMSYKDGDSDYLFSSYKFAHFPGRNLSKKRNLVKQLSTHHEVRSEIIENQIHDAMQILESWNKDHLENSVETDFSACQEAILNFKSLHLHGRIVYVDNQPSGFTIGEWLCQNCYVIHFCKGNRTIKGLYQYLYQELAQSIEENCKWMNIEQDLGFPAIHDAKHSYLPDLLAQKWRLKIKS